MRIASEDVIQADSPDREMQAIEAVAHGAKSDGDIARAIGGLDARQGRYYRRAGEVLGFLRRDAQNESALTPLGREYAAATAQGRRDLMLCALLTNPLVQRLIPFLEAKGRAGATRAELERFLAGVAELGTQSMAHRRASSYIQWMKAFGLANIRQGNLVLQALPSAVPIINFTADDEPLFPTRCELREYEARAREFRERKQTVTVLIDQARRERAVNSHQMLTDLVASRLRDANAIPKANRYIDLAAKVSGENFLFEMKSTTDTNVQSQVRRGLSQLYEYRYLQQIEPAKLVLVIENPLPRPLSWIETYLRTDRNVLLVWDGNNRLSCSEEVRRTLAFLC
jgi:hypothetical protein